MNSHQQDPIGQVYIIRHAESKYNEAVKYDETQKPIAKHDPNLIDA